MKFIFFAVGWIDSTHGSKNARNASHTSQLNSIHSFPHILFRYGAKNTNRSWLSLFYLNSYSWWRKKPLQWACRHIYFQLQADLGIVQYNGKRSISFVLCVKTACNCKIRIDPISFNLSPTRHLASKKRNANEIFQLNGLKVLTNLM